MWVALSCFEDAEKHVNEKLGVAGYYPKKTLWSKSRRRKRKAGEPSRVRRDIALIPGYVFCQTDLISELDLNGVLRDRKVLGLLKTASTYEVGEKEILALIRSEEAGDYDETRKLFSGIVGASHEIISGPFIGRTATVSAIENGNAVARIAGLEVTLKIPLPKFDEIRHTDQLDDREHERSR